MLRAVVEDVRVVPADHHRRHPLEAVPQILRRHPQLELRVEHDVAALTRLQVVPVHDPAVAPRVDDVGPVGVEGHRTGLAAPDILPMLLRVQRVHVRPGGHRDRGVVLLGPVEPIGEAVVDDDVVEFGGGLVVVGRPGLAAVHGHLRAPVVRHHHAVGVVRMDPQVVHVAVRHGNHLEGRAAIHRPVQAGVERVDGVRVDGVGLNVRVVPGALAQVVVRIGAGPGRAPVVGTVDAAVGLGLDDRPHAVGIRGGHGHAHLPHHPLGETPTQLGPNVTPVGRLVDAALFRTRDQRPRLALPPPHPRIQNARVGHVHSQIGRAGQVVERQDMLPGIAAVARTEDPPLGVLAERVTEGGHIDQVVVARMHLDTPDLPRLGKPDEGPGPPIVHRLPRAPPGRRVAPDAGRALPDVDHVLVRIGHPDRADRPPEVPVGDVVPSDPVVGGFPDAAAGRAQQPAVGVVQEAGCGGRATAAERTCHAIAEVLEGDGVELLRREGGRVVACHRGSGESEGDDGRAHRWSKNARQECRQAHVGVVLWEIRGEETEGDRQQRVTRSVRNRNIGGGLRTHRDVDDHEVRLR